MFFKELKMEDLTLGARILSTILFSLLMVGAVDIFLEWYRTFLQRRKVDEKLILLLRRLTFVILAFIFWRSLVSQQETGEFASTHFFFTLFIYCFYRLISTFFKGRREEA